MAITPKMIRASQVIPLAVLCVSLCAVALGSRSGNARWKSADSKQLTRFTQRANDALNFFPLSKLDAVLDILNASLRTVESNLTSTCYQSYLHLIDSAANDETWSLKIFDAIGKPSSGFLESSLTFLGDYSECLEAVSSPMASGASFHGSYCLASLKLDGEQMQRIGEETGVSWGLLMNRSEETVFGICFPSTCSSHETTLILNTAFCQIMNIPCSNGTHVINLNSCSDKESTLKNDAGAIIVLTIFIIFILMAISGTLFDVVTTHKSQNVMSAGAELNGATFSIFRRSSMVNDPKTGLTAARTDYGSHQDTRISVISSNEPVHSTSSEALCELPAKVSPRETTWGKLLICFSVKTNGQKILQTNSSTNSIEALNGIRVISMWWIIVGHSFSFALQWLVFSKPSSSVYDEAASVLGQVISNGTFSVDTFFYLSGFLLAFVGMKQLKKTEGKLSIPVFYFHRFWRMTPLMMAIIAFCATLLQYIGEGPKWGTAIQMYDSWCKQNWYINLVYLHNFIHTPNMCLSHSWYSAVDMQFYLISPIVLISLYRRPRIGFVVVAFLMLFSIFLTAILTAVNDYPAVPYVNEIVPLDLMNEYYRVVYIKPYCRIGPYLIGILMGYFAATKKGDIVLRKYVVVLGWSAATVCNLAILYGMLPASMGQRPTVAEATIYGSTTRTFWACALAWITFACMYGYGGVVNKFLSWRVFAPLGRLTYCAYLIHPVVMASFYGSRQGSYEISNFFMVYVIIGNIFLTYVCSFVLSLLFESPFLGLEKILLGSKKQ